MRNGELTFGIVRGNFPIGDDIALEIRRQGSGRDFECRTHLTESQQSSQARRIRVWKSLLIVVPDLREMR